MFSPQAALAFLKDRHAAFSLQHNVKLSVYPRCFPLAPSRRPREGAAGRVRGSAGEQGCSQTPPWRDVPRESVGRRAVRAVRWEGEKWTLLGPQVHMRLCFRLWNITVMRKPCTAPAGHPPSASESPAHTLHADTADAPQPRCEPPFPHLQWTHSISQHRTNSPVTSDLRDHLSECGKHNRLPASLRAQRGREVVRTQRRWPLVRQIDSLWESTQQNKYTLGLSGQTVSLEPWLNQLTVKLPETSVSLSAKWAWELSLSHGLLWDLN